jgi:dTDP-glucose pyrophosphorylase/predicted transcriptional regulator
LEQDQWKVGVNSQNLGININNMCDYKKMLISPRVSLVDAIKEMHTGGARILIVVDDDELLLGTITDGDIRRALIKRFPMEGSVEKVMNTSPFVIKKPYSRTEILRLMSDKDLLHMPIVDNNGRLKGVETLQHLIEEPKYDNPIFLMAGGFGSRLRPLTNKIPKPLLKVGKKPILETIIGQFIENGFHNFYISTHFKSELIKDYFKDGKLYGINIDYVDEDTPLGTAGSLGLLPDNIPDLPMIVMNGDLLTKVNFKELLDFHKKSKGDATMCVREYDFQVPYGVVNVDDCYISSIVEKPIHKFFVNAGIYFLNKKLLSKIDGKSSLDMTDFLSKELGGNGVNAFPIHEYWMDIGRLEEYEKANQDALTIFQ